MTAVLCLSLTACGDKTQTGSSGAPANSTTDADGTRWELTYNPDGSRYGYTYYPDDSVWYNELDENQNQDLSAQKKIK